MRSSIFDHREWHINWETEVFHIEFDGICVQVVSGDDLGNMVEASACGAEELDRLIAALQEAREVLAARDAFVRAQFPDQGATS